MALFAQTAGTHTTNATLPTPIPGLAFTLPEGYAVNAIIILNVPNPYAEGNDYPGGWFGIALNGTVLPATASFTYGIGAPPNFNRMPTTLIVSVPLALKPQKVQAMWHGIRGSTVVLDSPASLTGLID